MEFAIPYERQDGVEFYDTRSFGMRWHGGWRQDVRSAGPKHPFDASHRDLTQILSTTNMPSLTLIVAATLTNGIGHSGRLPWRISQDMAYFARVTTSAPQATMNAVIMGRNTWESIPPKFRPLKDRMNVIVSSNADYLKENSVQNPAIVSVQPSLPDAISSITSSTELLHSLHRIFIIGGASIYKGALDINASAESADNSTQSTIADRILITRIFTPAFEDCDVFFPEFHDMKAKDGTSLWTQSTHEDLEAWVGSEVPRGKQHEKGIEYEFQMWTRKT